MQLKKLKIPNLLTIEDLDSLYSQSLNRVINSQEDELEANLIYTLILNIKMWLISPNNNLIVENIKKLKELIYPPIKSQENRPIRNTRVRQARIDLLERRVSEEVRRNKILKNRKVNNNPRSKNKKRINKLYDESKIEYDGVIDTNKSRSAKFE